jgi:hypothetical protein
MEIRGEQGGKGNALANGVGNVDDDSDGIGEGGGGGEMGRRLLLLLLILKLI